MADVTCVVFVPRKNRDELRSLLQTGDTGELCWTERKKLFGSDFYFTGPSSLAMNTQKYISNWVVSKAIRMG